MDELKIWLELARSLFLKAGFVVVIFSLVYLARQTWRTRGDWRLGPPWSTHTRYLKKIQTAFAYTNKFDLLQSCVFHIVSSRPASDQRFNPDDAYDLDGLISLAVHERKLIVLAGATQSGKTALLHALALRAFAAEHHRKLGFAQPRTPLYIPLNVLDCTRPFVAALSLALTTCGMTLPQSVLKRLVRRGRALLLCDGLEEISESAQRLAFIEWLEAARANEGKNVTIIIATREQNLLANFEARSPQFGVVLRNFARPAQRSLGAVTETRMPKLLRNTMEAHAEYVLIAPRARVTLPGTNTAAPRYHYHLAKFPVTNARYRLFVQSQKIRAPLFWLEKEFAGEDLSVVGVDWEDAERYCEWLNAMTKCESEGFMFRLPHEEEWEWAASAATRNYPWGNEEPTSAHAHFGEQDAHLMPVQAHPLGATPEGVCELAGNVWEWTATASALHPDKRIVRGGAVFNEAHALRCTSRDEHAKNRTRVVGFRVVRVPLESF